MAKPSAKCETLTVNGREYKVSDINDADFGCAFEAHSCTRVDRELISGLVSQAQGD